MIRINLAKKGNQARRASSSGGSSPKNPFSGLTGIFNKQDMVEASEEDTGHSRALVMRLALLLLGSALLFAYEQANIPPKRSSVAKLRRDLDEVTKKNHDAEGAVAEIQRFEKEQTRLQSQIGAIEAVRRDRLREVRVLDYIQREIPEKVWLQKMDLVDNRLSISGFATADNELTTFMEGLQRSAYLKEVNLVRSNEAPFADFGLVKRFEITCLVEKTQ